MTTLYWYDYETFGADTQRDRPVQFAGVRTDLDLNVIGEPLAMYCKPANDFLPHPEACLITGITPQLALEKGIVEAEFIKKINNAFMQPHTCVVGYNNIRFDDEVTRFTLYRNFYDAYAREWQNGCSRWDLIDVVRLTYALRPEGVEWPRNEEGKPSFKLTDLTRANNIKQEGAHDALVDVYATIALAKLIREKQPKLYEYAFTHRDKSSVSSLLAWQTRKLALHVSSRFSADNGCLAMIVPLAPHPTNKNGVIVYDVSVDPTPLLTLTVEEIKERVFTKREELAAMGKERLPLKTIHINKCPIVLPLNVMREADAKRLAIDVAQCEKNAGLLNDNRELMRKIQAVFEEQHSKEDVDPDVALYSGGFFNDKEDKRLMGLIPVLTPAKLASTPFNFRDERLPDMLFRYRARNYLETLSDDEVQQWNTFRKNKLTVKNKVAPLTLGEFFAKIDELQQGDLTDDKVQVLNQLKHYGEQLLN